MNLANWLKPGLKIKRWLLLGMLGIILIAIGLYPFIHKILHDGPLRYRSLVSLLLLGILLVIFSIRKGLVSILNLLDLSNMHIKYKERFDQKIYKKHILSKRPQITVIGGGTGLAVLLRGLKKFTSNITAIVTVADDGGGSGILREDLGMLPPGDIRNCILALADTEPIMEQLLQYRFEEGTLKGQSFGNLLIAAMNGISDSFEEAIKKINQVLAVTGQVLPVTLEDITLYAKLKNGKVIKGESQIPLKVKEFNSEIEQVFIKPDHVKALKESVEAIYNADVVILGPGSLYTSIIPNLLVQEIREALTKTSAIKIYIANVMTQPGETDHYSVYQHVETILNYLKDQVIDYVFVNNEDIPIEILEKYTTDGAKPVKLTSEDRNRLYKKGIKVIAGPFIDIKKQYIRHNADRLSEWIIRLIGKQKYRLGKINIIHSIFLKNQMKNKKKSN
jgi:uncharacterized cofD-like protein